jgi:hypothetical protein
MSNYIWDSVWSAVIRGLLILVWMSARDVSETRQRETSARDVSETRQRDTSARHVSETRQRDTSARHVSETTDTSWSSAR